MNVPVLIFFALEMLGVGFILGAGVVICVWVAIRTYRDLCE